jgi:hypothetical protein
VAGGVLGRIVWMIAFLPCRPSGLVLRGRKPIEKFLVLGTQLVDHLSEVVDLLL